MRSALFFCLTLFVSISQAITLNEVVLAEDVMDIPTYYSFPCSKYMGVMFCENSLVLEKNCKATLKIADKQLSCRSLKGDTVVFAKVLFQTRFTDETQGGMNGYHLQFSDRVSLVSFKTPNGNIEYQVVVK